MEMIMRTMQIPELHFSSWYAWKNRQHYPLKQFPGVYLTAITDKPDLEGQEVSYEDVVYIGMTNSHGGLISRWGQFYNAISGKDPAFHSGGKSVYKARGPYISWQDHLYVAAMGVECNVIKPTDADYVRMGWVAYLEYEAFAQYYLWGISRGKSHPIFNTK
jgi:hypothetical protein